MKRLLKQEPIPQQEPYDPRKKKVAAPPPEQPTTTETPPAEKPAEATAEA